MSEHVTDNSDYYSYHENDYIVMVLLKDEKEPCFAFHLDEWYYDDEIHKEINKTFGDSLS